MRTKSILNDIRIPITRVRYTALKEKFDDIDDYLDAIKTTTYSAAGAISPSDGLAIIDSTTVGMLMTLVDGTVTGERIDIVLSSGTSAIVAPENMVGGSEILLSSGAGPRVRLIWNGSAWAHSGHAGSEGELTSVAHGLLTGDGPFYFATTTTLPAGATALTDYWVIKLTDDKLQLATSQANAVAGTAITVTDAGTGTLTLTRLVDITSYDDAADTFTKIAHGIADERKVHIEVQGAGVLPGPLVTATDYWAIVAGDPDVLQLATSLVNAQADTQIDLDNAGAIPLRILDLDFLTITAVDFATA